MHVSGCTAATDMDMDESHKQSTEQKKQVPEDFCIGNGCFHTI